MKAVIIYDTKFGNTEEIAKAICSGMKEVGFNDVSAKSGGATTPNELRDAELWIFGCPTQKGGTSGKYKKLFKWMRKNMVLDRMGFAFETRLEGSEGGAAAKIEAVMQECGVEIIHEPESFVVEEKTGPLAYGEIDRATTFGRKIAGEMRD
ncbi:MAG TPA: flavodoxin domain-containing protein [Methanomassiliicoccales archaeon]|nr:flavodoxin domain-containing protein [Methanomassiliicoccales archaeon]